MTLPLVEEICIPESIAQDYAGEGPYKYLSGIKRLNAFVGPNNSGKSRLLRGLFLNAKKLLISTNNEHARKVRECAVEIEKLRLQLPNSRYFDQKFEEARKGLPLGFHECAGHLGLPGQRIGKLSDLATHIRNYAANQSLSLEMPIYDKLAAALHGIANGMRSLATTSEPRMVEGKSEPALPGPFQNAVFAYVPTLRGMRLGGEGQQLNSDTAFAYFDRTWSDYLRDSGPKEYRISDNNAARENLSGKTVLTGLDFYKVLTDHLLGDLKEREFIREYQDYLSKTFFRNERVALIPRRDHDTVNIKIGNEKERPIQSLGDGLQQLIILTLPLFQHRDVPLFLFIEEPDLFLHPGYQRVLIDTILDDPERSLHVFVTTHSSQFLDITISNDDCSIFRCSKMNDVSEHFEQDPKFEVTNAFAGDNELLKHIGVRPSSVMFSNCTIWVEGITDRLYYSRYVKILLEEKGLNFIENLHYSFVEYGGGNVTHWSFLDEDGIDVKRLCSKLMLIADKDNDKEDRHGKLAKELGKLFVRLSVRESENLLSPEVIKNVIDSYEAEDVELNPFAQADYAEEYLGSFIDDKVLVDKRESKRFQKKKTAYEDTSGTVKDKVTFCRRALRHIKAKSDMSADAIKLAERICQFIEDENR